MIRRKPYTDRGIKRVPCARCDSPSRSQWQICALNNEYKGFCVDCDIELNRLVLGFLGIPSKEIACLMDEYEYEARGRVGCPPDNDTEP